MASIAVMNETVSRMERQTKDGRTLLYQMEVVQQPERARACGAGAKSSADRRPVDPPPIVDLRIYEVRGEERKDITFSHKANFFLYTTLEHARPMNQGRVAVSAATLPVLTGTPVAGISYLDRPKPAGYFIFPDLSVRHEGKYRLSFNLYEGQESENDADPDTPADPNAGEASTRSSVGGPRNFVHFRLEVKSNPFNVFSAKKFPGLTESTALSRVVNEQGCRVRIRRDVRMRRRDKVSDSYTDMADDIAPPSDRYPTHQQPIDRPRSTSNASEVPSHYSTERRQSYHDIQYYQAPVFQQPQPPPPQSSTSYTSHLSFGGSNTPHYQTPTMVTPQHPPMTHAYQQSTQGYPYAPHTHARQPSGPPSYGYPSQPPQQATYGPPASMDERPYPDSRRSSGGYSIGRSQPMIESYDHSRSAIQPSTASSQMRSLTPLNTNSSNQGLPSLPPIKALVPHSPLEPMTSEPKSSASAVRYGPHNPFSAGSTSSGGYQGYSSTTPQTAQPISASQPKRAYGEVFDPAPMNHPMHGGMRPNTAVQSQDLPHIETADGEYAEYGDVDDLTTPLIYKRADGSRRAKKCPSPKESYRYISH